MNKANEIIEYFYCNYKKLYDLDTETIRDIAAFSWHILNDYSSQNTDYRIKSFCVLAFIVRLDSLTLVERSSIYYQLIHRLFINTIFDSANDIMRESYYCFCIDIEKSLPAELLSPLEGEIDNKNIVITTGQFLSIHHAPTRRVLDYAYTIEENTPYKVVIINTSVLNPIPVNYISEGYDNYSYEDSYCNYNKLEYNGRSFPFYQVETSMPNTDSIIKVIRIIRDINPYLVFNVGAHNYVSDICRYFTLTASIPCATSIPVSMSEKLVLGRNLRESDNKILGSLLPHQFVIESNYNYIMPEESSLMHYSRESINLPKDGWLICSVGNRMEAELDNEFLNMMDTIVGSIENAYYVIIGHVDDTNNIVSGLDNKEKFIITGQKVDASQIVRLCNLYAAPTRKGGGRSTFESLYYGVPVVVTTYGDSWDTCGDDYAVDDYKEMAMVIKRYYSDRDFYNRQREKAIARGQELEDMASTFNKLFIDLKLL